MSREPRISLCQLAFPMTSFEQDVAIGGKVGAGGLGLDEHKLVGAGDAAYARRLRESGLRATICVTEMIFLLPHQHRIPSRPEPGPADPAARIEALCAGIRRLAAFEPEVVFCCTGPAGALGEERARAILVDGLRAAASTAAEVGVRFAIEPMREQARAVSTMVASLAEAVDLLDEVGDRRVGIILDAWHLWDSPGILESARRLAGRIAGVQVADYREPRSARDRLIPGEGSANLPALLEALEAGGYAGWYDLEIFSDELWQLEPEEFARRSVEGLRRVLPRVR